MNTKYVMLTAVVAMSAILAGCESSKPARVEPSHKVDVAKPNPPHRKVDAPKPQPTPEDRARTLSNALWAQIKPLLAKHDYDAARKAALSGRDKEDAEIADNMLAVRVGLVTSVINPAELDWRVDNLIKKIDAYCAKGDFDSAYAALELERKHWHDMEFTKVDESLERIRKELVALSYSDSLAKAYVGKYRSLIDNLINDRRGKLVFRADVSKAIEHLERIIRKELPEDQKESVDSLVKRMRDELRTRNLTTAMLDRSMSTRIEDRMSAVALERLAALQVKVAVQQALSNGIDLNDEIDAMEEAARINHSGRSALFAECARGFRTMLAASDSGKLDYQNLLSAAILLERRSLMEMAVKCGADVTIAAPNDPKKTVPFALAVEVGNKHVIAWLCDKGVQAQVAQLSVKALGIAVRKNRLDLFKYLQKIGCTIKIDELKSLFSLCCEVGADNLHEYLFSLGVTPTVDDFVKAVKIDNLVIVKWFVESRHFSVNSSGVPDAAKQCPGVLKYLSARGMR